MARPPPRPPAQVRLRERRQALGLSQAELAARVGVTRQSILAIEAGGFLPNTAIALALAAELDCRVEDLFALAGPAPERPVELAARPTAGGRRVALARVRGRMVAFPLEAEAGVAEGFTRADGLLVAGDRDAAELLVDPASLDHTALMLGCDPAFEIVRDHIEASGGVHLRWLPTPSRQALAQLGKGLAHLAGTHLPDGGKVAENLKAAKKALAGPGGLVVAFASWEQGLVVAPGNPLALRGVEDLVRCRARLVNRPVGTGSRAMLDALLEARGIAPAGIFGFEREVGSHLAVARAVRAGTADAGPAIRAAAAVYGLGFVPLGEARFDLAIPADQLEHPAVARLVELLQGARLRREVGALPGYDTTRMGTVLAHLPAAG